MESNYRVLSITGEKDRGQLVCGTCHHWHRSGDHRECRLNPPDNDHHWPETDYDDGCGQWTYRPPRSLGEANHSPHFIALARESARPAWARGVFALAVFALAAVAVIAALA